MVCPKKQSKRARIWWNEAKMSLPRSLLTFNAKRKSFLSSGEQKSFVLIPNRTLFKVPPTKLRVYSKMRTRRSCVIISVVCAAKSLSCSRITRPSLIDLKTDIFSTLYIAHTKVPKVHFKQPNEYFCQIKHKMKFAILRLEWR